MNPLAFETPQHESGTAAFLFLLGTLLFFVWAASRRRRRIGGGS